MPSKPLTQEQREQFLRTAAELSDTGHFAASLMVIGAVEADNAARVGHVTYDSPPCVLHTNAAGYPIERRERE